MKKTMTYEEAVKQAETIVSATQPSQKDIKKAYAMAQKNRDSAIAKLEKLGLTKEEIQAL